MVSNKITVIYLAGYGKSGTTLLDLVFNGHPEIIGVGGLGSYRTLDRRKMNRDKARLDKACACGKMVSKCPFWQKVFENIDVQHGLQTYMKLSDFFLNKARYVYYNDNLVDIADYVSCNELIYANIARVSSKQTIFDSSRNPFRIELLARSQNIRLVLLHVLRNGEACISSNKKKRPRSFFRPLLGWLKANIVIEFFRYRYPEIPYIFLRYEDFTKNPEKELERVLAIIGLKFDPEMMRFRSHESHNFSGNLHRLDKNLSEKIMSVIPWRKRITWYEHWLFFLLGGWLNWIYVRRAARQREVSKEMQ